MDNHQVVQINEFLKFVAPSDMAKGQPWQKREGMPNWQPPGDIPNGQLPTGQSVNLKIIL